MINDRDLGIVRIERKEITRDEAETETEAEIVVGIEAGIAIANDVIDLNHVNDRDQETVAADIKGRGPFFFCPAAVFLSEL